MRRWGPLSAPFEVGSFSLTVAFIPASLSGSARCGKSLTPFGPKPGKSSFNSNPASRYCAISAGVRLRGFVDASGNRSSSTSSSSSSSDEPDSDADNSASEEESRWEEW